MSTAKRSSAKGKQKKNLSGKSPRSGSSRDHTVYKDFNVYTGKTRPDWHPVKKMRYVFFRMIHGETITDAINEIRWNAAEFWHLVDKDRQGPFALEYKRAKKLQGRAFADQVVTIAEGRDRVTKMSVRTLKKMVKKALRKASKQKTALGAKAIVDNLLAQIDSNEHRIIARNKMQIDAAKWVAKTSNPTEYGDQSKVALGAPDGEGETENGLKPLLIQFVGPDGKVVSL